MPTIVTADRFRAAAEHMTVAGLRTDSTAYFEALLSDDLLADAADALHAAAPNLPGAERHPVAVAAMVGRIIEAVADVGADTATTAQTVAGREALCSFAREELLHLAAADGALVTREALEALRPLESLRDLRADTNADADAALFGGLLRSRA